MRKIFLLLINLISLNFCFSQNTNLVLMVNDQILNGEITNLYLKFENENETKKIYVNYYPGDLILNSETLELINSDKTNKIYLHFDYNTFKKEKHLISNFDIELKKIMFQQPYLIINVFDFTDKKYRKWYQYLTNENYLPQIIFPNSGIYVRMK